MTVGSPSRVDISLHGRRVLLVEDESLVLMLVEDMLLGLGAASVETAMDLDEGTVMARDLPLDLAVLDVNLAGQKSYPIAAVLAERGIPFLFATGYGGTGLEEPWSATPTLAKPFGTRALQQVIDKVLCR